MTKYSDIYAFVQVHPSSSSHVTSPRHPPLTPLMLLLRAIAGHLGALNEIGLW